MHHAAAATFVALALILSGLPATTDAASPADRGRMHKRKKVDRKPSLIDARWMRAPAKTAPASQPAGLRKGTIDWHGAQPDGLNARTLRLLERKATIRRAMILQLEKLAASRILPNEKKADVLFRLAEVWREESRYKYLMERRAYDRWLQADEARRARAAARVIKPVTPAKRP